MRFAAGPRPDCFTDGYLPTGIVVLLGGRLLVLHRLLLWLVLHRLRVLIGYA
jgi:hypothetical protein